MCFDVNADIARFYSVCFELAVLKLYRLAHTGARAHATHARVEKSGGKFHSILLAIWRPWLHRATTRTFEVPTF